MFVNRVTFITFEHSRDGYFFASNEFNEEMYKIKK